MNAKEDIISLFFFFFLFLEDFSLGRGRGFRFCSSHNWIWTGARFLAYTVCIWGFSGACFLSIDDLALAL